MQTSSFSVEALDKWIVTIGLVVIWGVVLPLTVGRRVLQLVPPTFFLVVGGLAAAFLAMVLGLYLVGELRTNTRYKHEEHKREQRRRCPWINYEYPFDIDRTEIAGERDFPPQEIEYLRFLAGYSLSPPPTLFIDWKGLSPYELLICRQALSATEKHSPDPDERIAARAQYLQVDEVMQQYGPP